MKKRSYTILYVDDDHDDLMMISEAFEQYTDHLNVAHAYNGQEALNILKLMEEEEKLPCLIILDINMPVMNGKEALREMRANPAYQGIPVILFSTSGSDADKSYALQYGADFVTKPVRYAELKTLVKEFVNRCRIPVAG